MKLILYIINLISNLNISKKQFSFTVEEFCFQYQLQIMIALCIVYVSFFCCICESVTAVIVIFWFGFLFTLAYLLKTLKVPVLNTVLIVVFVVRTVFIAQKENILPSIGLFLFVFLFLGGLYFSFENNSLILRIKTFFHSLKEDRLVFENCVKTKFEYLEVLSTVVSCISVILILLNFIFNVNIYSFYEKLNPEEQGLFLILFLSFLFFVVVSGFLDLLVFEAFNCPVVGFYRYLFLCERLTRVFCGTLLLCVIFDQFAMSPSTPSTAGIDIYRIYFWGYSWTSAVDATLALEYKIITGGLPPLSETKLVDGFKTAKRLEVLKRFHSDLLVEFSKAISEEVSINTLLDLHYERISVFNSFVQEVNSGYYDNM